MSQINNIISKVLSGNASDSEKELLQKFVQESEENNAIYQERLMLWQFVGKVQKTPTVDIVSAWEKFNLNKESIIAKENKSYFYYKIAAVFIVLLISGSMLFMFNSGSKDILTPTLANKTKVEKTNKIESIQIASSKKYVSSAKEKVSNQYVNSEIPLTHEVALEDSSIAMISKSSVLSFLNNPESQTRITSLSGAGMFDISEDDKDFVLETEELKIIVQGTKFNIKTATEDSKFVEITVEEGFMQVSEKLNAANKVSISSNQRFIYDIEKHTFSEVKIKPISKWQKFMQKFQKNN